MINFRDEKGFTLVELLVSMCILAIVMTELMALMFNSSKLYKNGAFEVSLQSEAQQIIQQFEELTIDADLAVSYNEATQIISVSNNTGHDSYEFSLSPVAGKPYNDLMLKVNGGTAQIMGEYVKSISLNMVNYDAASRIQLIVEMENDKYSYTAAKDIYLRNDIGANDSSTSHVVSDACDYSLNILRYKTYNLGTLFGTQYIYAFDEDVHLEYGYTGPTKSDVLNKTNLTAVPEVSIPDTIINDPNNDNKGWEYLVLAYEYNASTDSYDQKFKIKCYTDPIMMGMDGTGIYIVPNSSYSYQKKYQDGSQESFEGAESWWSVQGLSIDPDNGHLSSIKYDAYVKLKSPSGSGTVPVKMETTWYDVSYNNSGFTNQLVASYPTISNVSDMKGKMYLTGANNEFRYKEGGTEYIETHIYDNTTHFFIDQDGNNFCMRNKCQYQGSSQFNNFINKYGVPYIKVTFVYTSPSREFTLNLYPMPTASSASYPLDVSTRFFEFAK